VAELADLQPGVIARGLVTDGPVTVLTASPAGSDALRVVIRTPHGAVHEQLVYRFQATNDEGFDAKVVRDISENAITLKFEQYGFE